jgi:hypothetical protein
LGNLNACISYTRLSVQNIAGGNNTISQDDFLVLHRVYLHSSGLSIGENHPHTGWQTGSIGGLGKKRYGERKAHGR